MPTLSGWCVLVGGGAFVTAGRLFGAVELLVAGIAALAVVLLAVVMRWLRPSRLEISRRLDPPRVPAGSSARVEIEFANRSRTRSPLLVLRDALSETDRPSRDVQLSLAPLRSGERCVGTYPLSAARRGVIELGPLRIDDVDAMGFARRSHRFDLRARLVVHPPVEDLSSIRLTSGQNPLLGPELHRVLGMGDEEFNGLREYVPGDDLRRIHWRSSARSDDLQVRQFHPPSHGSLSVVIDTRPPGDQRSTLDITTSIAASIAVAALASGDTVRVETSDGRRTTSFSGGRHALEILEFLALLRGGDEPIHPSVADAPGTVLAVTADPAAAAHHTVRRQLAQRLGAEVTITVDTSLWSLPGKDFASTPEWIHLSGPGQLDPALRRRHRAGGGSLRAPDAVPDAVSAGARP